MATPKVAPWPAIPISKPEEVYAWLTDQAKEYPLFLESIVRQEHNFEKPEALSRLRVLDCSTRMMIGHWCSSLLAELGAEVIQVEPPGGDPLRQNTPFGRRQYMFRDKETGEEVGGQFVHGTGDPKEFGGQPTRSALWMADHVGGTSAAMGILAAVLHRENVSGQGQFIEATAAEAIIRILDYNWAWHSMDGSIRPRYGNWDLAINIYAVNPCKDGYMMVGGGHDRLWYRIWRTVGDEYPTVEEDILGDPHLREVADRLAHDMQVKTYTMLGEWLKDNPRSEAERKLSKQQVASGGVLYVNEVAEYPHFKYRGHVGEYDSPHYGKILYGTTPFLQQKTPGRLKWLGRPTGYDNGDVYRRLLGLNREDFTRLKQAKVI